MSDKIKWTPAQKQAIEASNCDLLVSASAGSGKTRVLVQRVLDHVTDESYNTDIIDMLVVTFTNAAAAQLREKLNEVIKTEIAKDPLNSKRMRKQLRDISRASICTINSFCLDVVKTHFAELGLSANLRIADESENQLLMAEIMEQTIERFYDHGKDHGIEDFSAFCDNFARLRDDALGETFLSLYDKLYSQIDSFEILQKRADELDSSCGEPFENIYGREIRNHTVSYIEALRRNHLDAIRLIEATDGLCVPYSPAYYDDLAIMDSILEACKVGYGKVREVIYGIEKYKRCGSKGKGCDYEAELVSNVRDFFKKTVKDKIKPLYANDVETANYLTCETARLNRELYCFLTYFHKNLMEEKKRRGIVSFADCEALTLQLLYNNGEPTEVAKKYRNKYKEVYIDEYQDVNSVQDAIFRMVSSPNTRFMVGDIKQSIYGFRGAEPKLFGDYRESFDDYTGDPDATDRGCKIFLSNNFRSAANILSFANTVSRSNFILGESSIEYMDGDDLVHSKTVLDEADSEPVTVALVEKNEEKTAEALYVCDRIEELFEKGVPASDITILVRSLAASALQFTQELDRRGIPYYCDVKKEFFDNPEIMLMLCWLNTIDNCRRDVYVCGILKSPIYNFTIDELITIRRLCPADTLYNSVVEYTNKFGFEKGARFIADTEALRTEARGKSAHEMVWKLMYDKGLMSVVTKDKSPSAADIAKNNMLLFYDYARNFENGEFKGIYNFLIYIQKVVDAGHSMPSASSFAGAGNAVKIMTIHHSKGLEFPYCFLCSCDKLTSTKDTKEHLLFHPDFGVASKISDKTGLLMYDSYILNALKSRICHDNVDEEFRVLYVALTRAVNRLWVTATVTSPSDDAEKLQNAASMRSKPYFTVKHSYIAWILAAISNVDGSVCRIETVTADDLVSTDVDKAEKSEGYCPASNIDMAELYEHISYSYPYTGIGNIPSKMAVSRLYPDILDDIGGNELSTVIKPKKPFFAQDALTNRGAEIGNATHAFMQFCDYDMVDREGISTEIDRLCSRSFITPMAKELVDVAALKKFFSSELYREMRNSAKVFREKRFNVNLPASDFSTVDFEAFKDETVLVQGVIDCFFYNKEGNIVLVDYKTDSIKGAEVLVERYANQLNYYKKALETITGDKVVRTVIYSFSFDCCIEL